MKGGTYTEGYVYYANPIFRQQVVPGQTVNLDVEVSLKSAAFTKNLTTPCMNSIWFFYVPHRLVWDQWTDFISKQEGTFTFPTVAGNRPAFFDLANGSQNMSTLYMRAYKLIYNEYFGTEQVGNAHGAWYDDITDDSISDIYLTRNVEQFASKITLNSTVDDPEFTVTGSTIPLNDFYRQMMNARSQQRSQMTGDKYVDTLARMGVDATWMIAERPEFLGTKSQFVAPSLTANTSNTDTGNEVARFSSTLKCQIKNKHFAEHGYIVGIASQRPIIMGAARGAQDALPTGGSWIDSFYSADNLDSKDTVDSELQGFTADDAWSQRFAYLKNGTWNKGRMSEWIIEATFSDFKNLIYPNNISFPHGTELGSNDYAATLSYSMTGKTPVPNRVA